MSKHGAPDYGDVINSTKSAKVEHEGADREKARANVRKRRANGAGELGSKFFFDGFVVDHFVQTFSARFRHVHRWGQWLKWDGRRWQPESTQLVRFLLGKITARIANQRKKRLSAGRIEAIERLAQTQRIFAMPPDIWDTNPFVLNTETCVVDLSTGNGHPHDPAEHLTKITSAAGSGGDCPRWKRFLDQVTAGDIELQAYLQRAAGYCLTGSTREHVFFYAYGTGANGKSTFVEVLSGVLGSYARNVPAETFLESKHERHPTELAAMQGFRLITATEVKRGARWHETRLKELTGGDIISARFMRQDFFEYKPQFKLLLSGNHKPTLRSVDEAMRRRLHLLPFTLTIPKSERIKGLSAQLLAEERHGILAWALEGCRDWQAEGLNPPSAVLEATNAYFEAMDVIGRWVGERCEVGKAFHGAAGALFDDWKGWCEVNGEFAGSQKSFGQTLESQGFTPRKLAGARAYVGLRLVASASSESPL